MRAMTEIAKRANYSAPKLLRIQAYTEVPGGATRIHDRYLLCPCGTIRIEHGFQALPGGRKASIAPETQATHADLMSLFMEGKHDLKIISHDIQV